MEVEFGTGRSVRLRRPATRPRAGSMPRHETGTLRLQMFAAVIVPERRGLLPPRPTRQSPSRAIGYLREADLALVLVKGCQPLCGPDRVARRRAADRSGVVLGRARDPASPCVTRRHRLAGVHRDRGSRPDRSADGRLGYRRVGCVHWGGWRAGQPRRYTPWSGHTVGSRRACRDGVVGWVVVVWRDHAA